MSIILSIDPGNKKSGFLIADSDKEIVLEGKIVRSLFAIELISSWKEKYKFDLIVLGNGTSSKSFENEIIDFAPIEIVDESDSTLRARNRYWELWPPGKWANILPRGLLIPKDNLDAVAAFVLLEDYLGKKLIWIDKPNFKI